MARESKIYIYNLQVDHRTLADGLREKRDYLVCVLNTQTTRFPLTKFMSGEYATGYNTYVTKQDEFLIINMYDRKRMRLINRIVLKSRAPEDENEFHLKCLEYYSILQKKINNQINPLGLKKAN